MNKGIVIGIVVCLAVGVFVFYQTEQKNQLKPQPEKSTGIEGFIKDDLSATQKEKDDLMHQAQAQAKVAQDEIIAKSKVVQSQLENEVNELKTEAKAAQNEVQAKANALKSEMAEILSKAKELLNSGNYQEAISAAQNILSNFDSNSSEAKGIIEQAKVKIQELAQDKIDSVKDNLTGKIPSFGK